MALKSVATVVYDGLEPFTLGVLCEAFGDSECNPDGPTFDFTVCTPEPGTVTTSMGFSLQVDTDLAVAETADLVAVPSMLRSEPVPEKVIAVLRDAVDRGARVLSVCTGVFVLGEAGLLDGRECTTHWRYADELAQRFPKAKVNPDVLYVDADPVVTSAGAAAGLDACLYLIRKEFGGRTALEFARRMVMPPQRDGGQAQYVETPVTVPPAGTLEPVLTWIQAHLDQDMTVHSLAERSAMSPRTFARRFRAETGTTPHKWITAQRVLLAERLLEETDAAIETIAVRTGFGNAAALRHHFVQVKGTTPQAYRRTFSCAG